MKKKQHSAPDKQPESPADQEAQTPWWPVEKPQAPAHPENPDRLSGSELKAQQRQERREARLKEKGY